MDQFELQITNYNYDVTAFLSRVRHLLARDEQLLGPVIQRSVVITAPGGEVQHAITRLDVLPKSSAPGVSEIADYGKLKYVREILEQDALLTRLTALVHKSFQVGTNSFSSVPLARWEAT